MAIQNWFRVACDSHWCGNATHLSPSSEEATEAAERAGWLIEADPPNHRCPACVHREVIR